MKYRIWERGVYKAQVIEANNMHLAVTRFAGISVLGLTDWTGVPYTHPSQFIASDGSARQFSAEQVHD